MVVHTSLKISDVPSSEKGRHERNGVALVMFEKNVAQDTLVKFEVIISSNGWGNGVGRTGGEAGIVGIVWEAVAVEELEGDELEEEEAEEEVAEGEAEGEGD